MKKENYWLSMIKRKSSKNLNLNNLINFNKINEQKHRSSVLRQIHLNKSRPTISSTINPKCKGNIYYI